MYQIQPQALEDHLYNSSKKDWAQGLQEEVKEQPLLCTAVSILGTHVQSTHIQYYQPR